MFIQLRHWISAVGQCMALIALATLSMPALTASVEQLFTESPVFTFDRGTSLENLKKTYPDLVYDDEAFTYLTRKPKNAMVEQIAFTVYEGKLTSSRVTLRQGLSSSAAIAAAAKRVGYSVITQRDVGVVASHSNGSSLEASTSRRKLHWKIVVGPKDAAHRPKPVVIPKGQAAAPTKSALGPEEGAEVLAEHLLHFLDNAPLMHFTQTTSLQQLEQYYPGLALLSGKVSDYGAVDASLDFVERVEFHTENEGKRLTWIGVYFKPGLDQSAMAEAFSSVLKQKYGKLIRDTSSEHLVRRKDFTNAFHTRWYFRQKQWSAGIYPPK
ncbi:MAG: hypothetical protein AB8C02_07455 [Halioglobus sp.]